MRPVCNGDSVLSKVLSGLGYTTAPIAGPRSGRAVQRGAETVCKGTCFEVWAWLIDTEQVRFDEPGRGVVEALDWRRADREARR